MAPPMSIGMRALLLGLHRVIHPSLESFTLILILILILRFDHFNPVLQCRFTNIHIKLPTFTNPPHKGKLPIRIHIDDKVCKEFRMDDAGNDHLLQHGVPALHMGTECHIGSYVIPNTVG